MKKNFLMMAFVSLFTIVALSSCEKNEKDTVEVTEVTLDKTTLTLAVDSSETLTATVKPDDKTVVWATSDSTKVTVTNDGIVTAIATGSATVTATAGGKYATCKVTVIDNSGGIDNTITAKVEAGSSLNGKIDTVEVVLGYKKDNGNYGYYAVANAPYSNGGFTLQLPEDVSDTYLEALNDMPDGLNVSNPNVKIGWTLIRAYEKGANVGRRFYLGTGITATDWRSQLIYSNGDVSMTGSFTDEGDISKYNVHLKKGWNIMYEKSTDKGNDAYEFEITTTAPSGAKWYYENDYSDYENKNENSSNGSISNTLTVTVENDSILNGQIDIVKLNVGYENSYVATSAAYNNGSFTLILPEDVSDMYLEALDVSNGVEISNHNVKIGGAYIEAYKANVNVGEFYFGTGITDADWRSQLIYSNVDVSITGFYADTANWISDRVKYTEKYNVHLKKGWNLVYGKETDKGNNTYEIELTTTAPSGVKWYFYGNYSTNTKSLGFQVKKTPLLSSKRK
jgi:hypothetical protein